MLWKTETFDTFDEFRDFIKASEGKREWYETFTHEVGYAVKYRKLKGKPTAVNHMYTERGFVNRGDYLESLADDHSIAIYVVRELAYLLGQDEDFDGLVTSLEDMGQMGKHNKKE